MPLKYLRVVFSIFKEKIVLSFYRCFEIHAVVVTFVAGSLEAGGLPGYPEVLVSLK